MTITAVNEPAPRWGWRLREEIAKMVRATLHLGAHRCATTTFQSYLDTNEAALARSGMTVWTPKSTRAGLFDRLICQPGQDGPEVHAAKDRLAATVGAIQSPHLLISEENMIGAPRDNLDRRALYPGLKERLGRFAEAIGGSTQHVGLAIRSYDSYWSSLLAFSVLRGFAVPQADVLTDLSDQPRSWKAIIKEVRALFPKAVLHVWPFEDFASRPRQQLTIMSGLTDLTRQTAYTHVRKNYSRDTHNLRRLLRNQGRAGEADMLPQERQVWRPFTLLQQTIMTARYIDDLNWLRQQRDPMIQFTEKAAVKVLHRTDPGGHDERLRQMGRAG